MPCVITELLEDENDGFLINLGSIVPVTLKTLIQRPNCGYPVDFTLTIDKDEGE